MGTPLPENGSLDAGLIEASFASLAPKGEEIAETFYARLFAGYPEVKPLFRNTDIAKQKQHLLGALAFAVGNLRNPEVLSRTLRNMGARHVGYGALEAHYPAVVDTMVESLALAAGRDWTEALGIQWRRVLDAVAEEMIIGARKSIEEKKMTTHPGNHAQDSHEHALRFKSSIDGSATAMMTVDRNLVITYMNQATVDMVTKNLSAFKSAYPGFDLSRLMGASIDMFHKNPAHQRTLLGDVRNLPHKAEIKVGGLTFALSISAMKDGKGDYIGNTLEWSDITASKAKETEVRRLMSLIEGSATNFMMCDLDLKITYSNPAVIKLLTKYQDDLRKFFPTLDISKLTGTCIDIFHKKPQHQRRLLSDLRNLPFQTEIKVGELEFGLNLTALYDAEGKHIGNGVEWIDQNARAAYRKEVESVLSGMLEGELSRRGREGILEPAFRPMIAGINSIINAIVEPLKEFKEKLAQVAGGDLSAYVTGAYKGDHQMLKNALNDTLDSLNDILGQVSVAADQVATGSRQVSDSSQALSQGATEQASSLEQITASMTELSSQTKQNAENATQANQLATSSRSGAEKGNQLMSDMVKAMAEIDESSRSISKIIKAIDEIAFQTNLLALNAAVEAARAGVHGKGFAVVAEEVRNLAARSAKAAKETTEMIEGSIKKVNQGGEIAKKTAESLVEIVTGVGKVTDLVGEIAAASNEQAQGINQVNQGLTQLDQVTQQNTSAAEESAAASQELSGQANGLRQNIAKFKLRPAEMPSDALPGGITPAMLEAIRQYMAAQGMPMGAPPVEPTRAATAAPKADWSAKGGRKGAQDSLNGKKPVISLDDRDFGKF